MAILYRRKCYVVLYAIVLLPALSFSQNRYSLSAITDSAHHSLPALMEKRALADAARARITETRHTFLPTVRLSEQVNAGTDNSLAGSYFTFGITPSTSAGVRADNNSLLASGNLAVAYGEYELYNFGLNGAKTAYARSVADMQDAALQKDTYLLDADIARLYLEMIRSAARLDADRQNIERYQRIFGVIRSLVLSGLSPGADSSMALAELSRARINYNGTQDKLWQTRAQLAYLSGISSAQLVADTLTLADMKHNLDVADVPAADSSDPVIDFYARQAATFAATDKLIGRSFLPKIMAVSSVWTRGSSIQYNDQYKDLATGLNYQRYNYAFGVAVTYSLFNEVYKHDKQLVNRYQWQAARYALQQQRLAFSSAAALAERSIATAKTDLKEIPIQLRAAEATYAQKNAQYKAGLISLIDLTNASFVLYRSQTDNIDAIIRLYVAQLDKATATGQLNYFIQNIKL